MLKNEKTFSTRLRALRGDVSQSAFAKSIGIKQTSLSAHERGRMEPSASIIQTICVNARVSADWLLGLSDNRHGGGHVVHASGSAVAIGGNANAINGAAANCADCPLMQAAVKAVKQKDRKSQHS